MSASILFLGIDFITVLNNYNFKCNKVNHVHRHTKKNNLTV